MEEVESKVEEGAGDRDVVDRETGFVEVPAAGTVWG